MQHIDVSSLSLSCSALHGTCYATKTTNMGQPFAVALGGISGRDTASCWTLHWLAALCSALEHTNTPRDRVDFLWFNAQPELANLQEIAPASYCTAMLILRWAATLPWQQPGQGLHSAEAKQLTLHSMKSTALLLRHSFAWTKSFASFKAITATAQICIHATTFLPAWMFSTASAKHSPLDGERSAALHEAAKHQSLNPHSACRQANRSPRCRRRR